jgi:hypothetical protein
MEWGRYSTRSNDNQILSQIACVQRCLDVLPHPAQSEHTPPAVWWSPLAEINVHVLRFCETVLEEKARGSWFRGDEKRQAGGFGFVRGQTHQRGPDSLLSVGRGDEDVRYFYGHG